MTGSLACHTFCIHIFFPLFPPQHLYQITGTVFFSSLAAGSHVITPQYRTPSSTTSEYPPCFFLFLNIRAPTLLAFPDGGSDYMARASQVVQLAAGTQLLLNIIPTETAFDASGTTWQSLPGQSWRFAHSALLK